MPFCNDEHIDHWAEIILMQLPFVIQLIVYAGICYGFKMMRLVESPNTAFTVLYTRFVEGEFV